MLCMHACMYVYCVYICFVYVCSVYMCIMYRFFYMCVVNEISHSFLSKIIRLENLLIICVVVA